MKFAQMRALQRENRRKAEAREKAAVKAQRQAGNGLKGASGFRRRGE